MYLRFPNGPFKLMNELPESVKSCVCRATWRDLTKMYFILFAPVALTRLRMTHKATLLINSSYVRSLRTFLLSRISGLTQGSGLHAYLFERTRDL